MNDQEFRHAIFSVFAVRPFLHPDPPWCGDRLAPLHERKPVPELQSMLRRVGLVPDLWDLPT